MGASRRIAVLVGLVAASVVGTAGPAGAEAKVRDPLVVTAGCNEPGGETFFIDVMPRGAVAFVLDDAGERTGEKLHLLSLDVGGFNTAGQLVFEDHQTWGNRTGQPDVIFCSGSFDAGDDVTAFFDVLATRR